VAPELFDLPAEDQPDGSLLFVGAFLHGPNVEAARWLCDAILPMVRRERPAARLSCVGGNPPPWLVARAGPPGLSVTGWVPDVRVHLARARIGLVPLRSGGGVKLKTLELMAAGKAIVTTPIGIEGIEARDGEHVLVAETAEAFAGCVVRLLDDAGLRQRLGRRARELARRDHSWAQNLGRLEDDYVNLVRAPAMPVACAV
jgi:glycosyltransferase involved in cell wall biosynthesis